MGGLDWSWLWLPAVAVLEFDVVLRLHAVEVFVIGLVALRVEAACRSRGVAG
jgi:hypothetical protein